MPEDVKIPGDTAREVLWGGLDGWEIVRDDIVDHRRWSVDHEIILKRLSDGEFFQSFYSVGATESQDELAWEYGDAVFHHVRPVEQTVLTYERTNPV